ncbi:hypothetical protein ACS0TY_016018 [Phlomoides rotata]
MQPIYASLKTGEQPSDKTEAARLQRRAVRYIILDDHLYKRGFSMPLLKCITTEQDQVVLSEIHGGHVAITPADMHWRTKPLDKGTFGPT